MRLAISGRARVPACENRTVGHFDAWVDRLLLAVATKATGRGITALAVVLYGGVGLAMPLLLGWSLLYLVSANIMGTLLAGTFVLVWFAVQVQAQQRRYLVEWTTDLRLLDAAEFEWLVGELFRREGWSVEESGSQDGPDGNVDLRLKRDGVRRIVQCKRWTSRYVGVDEIRTFAGTMLREGLAGTDGIFVTLSDFTQQARTEATTTGITLVDNRDLYARAEQVRRREPCPKCEAGMILDRSSRGWWLRCVAAGCDGKRDLGNDPARALELLIQGP